MPYQCHPVSLSGLGSSYWVIKGHLLKHFVLAVTNSKMSTASIDEKLSALSHTWILNLPLNPYLTSRLNSRKKAVNVKGSCEGHSPARTCVHHAHQWLPSLPWSRRLEYRAYACNFMVGLSLLLFTEDEILNLKELSEQDQRTIQQVL